ncbi:MAG: TolC family protein, partial [Bacteroidales bacterium]
SMINQVKRAYYAIMMAEDSYSVLKQSYDNAQYNALQYRNKYEQGVASEYDALRAEVQVRTIEPGLLAAENAVNLSCLWLKVLIGISESTELKITNRLTDYELNMYSKSESVNLSLENNTELKQLDLQTSYLRDIVTAQKAAFSPTLSAFANYAYSSMSDGGVFNQFQWIPSSMIGLSLSVPILQGGNKFFNKKKAQLSVDQMKYNRDDLIRNLTWRTSSAVDNIMASVKQIASSREGVRQAEKAYLIMNKRFEVGNATFVELNDANDALTNSRLAFYEAIHDYLVGEANLEEILGSADISKYEKTNKSKL